MRCESAKILAIFPTPCISHQLVFRSLINGLQKRGHEIVVITTDSQYLKGQTPTNLTEIISPNNAKIWHDDMKILKGNSDYDQVGHFLTLLKLGTKMLEEQLKLSDVKNLLSNEDEKFDIILVEQWIRPIIGFSYRFKAPVIAVSSLGGVYGLFELMGGETHPLLYPAIISKRIYNLNLWEKVSEMYKYYIMEHRILDIEKEDNKMLQRYFGSNIPSVSELEKNIQMVFLNLHSLWDANRPVPANVIYIGGLHHQPEKELPEVSDILTQFPVFYI